MGEGGETRGEADLAAEESGLSWRVCPDFERYQFLDDGPIDRGGQGRVYRVWDRQLRRVVALKRLDASGPCREVVRERFVAEASLNGQLQHPGFLPILDAGIDPDGEYFYTTHLLSGRSFEDLVAELHAQGPPTDRPLRRALETFRRLCGIVAFAHSQGVAHRDLKPNNVLFGHFEEVFLIDLGAATKIDPSRRAEHKEAPEPALAAKPSRPDTLRITLQSGRPYHPLFSPPEVLQRKADESGFLTDIYALGAILYYLCGGRLPYVRANDQEPDAEELVRRALKGPPEPLGGAHPKLSKDLVAIVEKAMAREPSERYADAEALMSDLDRLRDGYPVLASRPGIGDQVFKWAARHGRAIALGALVTLAVGLSASIAWVYKVRSRATEQVNHLRDAEISARSGKWSLVLSNLDLAERAGYRNKVDLGLRRHSAYVALASSRAADHELSKLEELTDLGDRRGTVLLRRAEHELFAPSTQEAGVARVREAMQLSLDPADRWVAEGLLAESTTNALIAFQQALRRDPYHHGAHRHSLGLEFMLARNDELESHFSTLRFLYPEDPTPVYLMASRLALDGRLDEAREAARTLGDQGPSEVAAPLIAGFRMMSDASRFFDLDAFLSADPQMATRTNQLMADAMAFFMGMQRRGDSTNLAGLRLPQLPCVKLGLEKGMRALLGVMLAQPSSQDAALQRLREAIQVHADGLLPLAAATIRAGRRPVGPEPDRGFLRSQVELLELASGLPSVLSGVPAIARFLAATYERDLAVHGDTTDVESRAACVRNLEWFIRNPRGHEASNRALFQLARDIGAWDLARMFTGRWESAASADLAAKRARIEIEVSADSRAAAARLIDEYLRLDPTNSDVLEMRRRLTEPASEPQR